MKKTIVDSSGKKHYIIGVEVAGKFATFTEPSGGSVQTTYYAPTASACQGIFSAIKRWKSNVIIPIRTEICCPINIKLMSFNYRGANTEKEGSNFVQKIEVIQNPCYKIFAEIIPNPHYQRKENYNTCHALQDILQKRIEKGTVFHQPFLGISELYADYVGEMRNSTFPNALINQKISSMLYKVFEMDGSISKDRYKRNVEIKNGILFYPNDGLDVITEQEWR